MKRDKLVELCAVAAHRVNAAFCAALGDHSQPDWEDLDAGRKDVTRAGVKQVLDKPEIGPAQLHLSWCQSLRKKGWRYGRVKDADAKTHPCLVDYEDLPRHQRLKDQLFRIAVLGVAAAQEES